MNHTDNDSAQGSVLCVGVDLQSTLQGLYGDIEPETASESQWMIALASQEETLYGLQQAVLDVPWVFLNHVVEVSQTEDMGVYVSVSAHLEEGAFLDAVGLNTSNAGREDPLDERIHVHAPDGLAYNVLDIPEIATFGTVTAATDHKGDTRYHLEKNDEAIRNFLAQELKLINHALAQIANEFDLRVVLEHGESIFLASAKDSSSQLEQITLFELLPQHERERFAWAG